LLGETDIEAGSANERAIRSAIRDHVYNALLDVILVFSKIEERDAAQLVDADDELLADGVADTLGFCYELSDRAGWDFQRLLYTGIETYYETSERRSDDRRDVDDLRFEVELSEPEPLFEEFNRAMRKVERGDLYQLTDRELAVLVKVGTVDASTLIEQYRESHKQHQTEESRSEWADRIERRSSLTDDDE
jgi:hypothetical protein